MSSDIPGGVAGGAGAADAAGAAGAAPRGRPRSQEADRAILTATVELLAERGLAAMSIEEVAARAGVGKTTIYRRWPSKGLLALDAFVSSFRAEQPQPDTGTLRGDRLSALHAWVRVVTQTATGPMLTGLIAEAQHDPELRGACGTGCSSPCAPSTGSCWTGPSPGGKSRLRWTGTWCSICSSAPPSTGCCSATCR